MFAVSSNIIFHFAAPSLFVTIAAFSTVSAQQQKQVIIVPSAPPTIAKQSTAAVNNSNNAASSPTNTILAFYGAMRERRFRDALLMTNLRAAVAPLSAAEMEDLRPDFEPLAQQTPAAIETSGEQINGNTATVFVKNTDPATGELKLDTVTLRRENNRWIILSGDGEVEKRVSSEGKNYFFNTRLETRHNDVELTLQDIISAELNYSLQNKGAFGDFPALTKEQLLSPDAVKSDTLGYNFRLTLGKDRKTYTVNAEPIAYGKTGKLSFLLTVNGRNPQIEKADKNGAPFNR